MRKLLERLFIASWFALPLYVWADYNATPGTGLIFRSFDATHNGTSLCAAANTQCQAVGLINSAGAEIGTSGAPVRTDPTGTTTQPVSGTITTTPPANASTNVTQVAGTALGATGVVAYGSTPPAVNVPGANVFVTNTNANGQATMANSSPVVLASNQSNVPTNTAQINGVTPLMGNGVSGTGSQRINIASDNTAFPIINAPTGVSGNALTAVTCGSAVSSCVLKNAAGNFYGVYAECTSACWLMVFNSASAPSNGATTAGTASGNLVECLDVAANSVRSVTYPVLPTNYSVGITAVISSTACATLTLSTVGFIRGTVL